MLRSQRARSANDATTQIDFEQAEKVQRHQGHQDGEHNQELRIAELHPPAGFVSRGFHADNQASQNQKRNQHAGSINEPKLADSAWLLL